MILLLVSWLFYRCGWFWFWYYLWFLYYLCFFNIEKTLRTQSKAFVKREKQNGSGYNRHSWCFSLERKILYKRHCKTVCQSWRCLSWSEFLSERHIYFCWQIQRPQRIFSLLVLPRCRLLGMSSLQTIFTCRFLVIFLKDVTLWQK